ELTHAKHALLEKYLLGSLLQTARDVNAISRRTSGKPAPLSLGQQHLWFLAQLQPDTPVYTEGVSIHLPEPLDVTMLEQAFNEIIRRHEAWRTSFPTMDGQPVQLIHPALRLPLPMVDLRHLP